MELWDDLCALPAPWCCAPLSPTEGWPRGCPGGAQAGELSWGWLEPSVEQGPGGIQQSAGIPAIPLGAGDPSSCWTPQQNPRGSSPGLAKALLGLVLRVLGLEQAAFPAG